MDDLTIQNVSYVCTYIHCIHICILETYRRGLVVARTPMVEDTNPTQAPYGQTQKVDGMIAPHEDLRRRRG